jgi:hypothetical protein
LVKLRFNWSINFFVGFAMLMAVVSIASIFFAIGFHLFLLTIAISLSLLLFNYKHLLNYLEEVSRNKIEIIFNFTLLIVLSIGLSAEIKFNDSGFYHIQSIKWIREFPVIPGLGNIHGRFAFNSHFFTISSLFSFNYSIGNNSVLIYPLNAAAIVAFTNYLITKAHSNFDRKEFLRFALYVSIVIIFLTLYPLWINTPSPDIISSVLVVLSLVYFLESTFETTEKRIGVLSIFIFSAVVIKLSSLFLALLFLPLLWKIDRIALLKNGVRIALIGSFFLLPFLVRNYFLSGYLVYPISAIDIFNVDWKILKPLVDAEKNWIEHWAKLPAFSPDQIKMLNTWEWVPDWWNSRSIFFKILIGGNLLIPFSAFICLHKKKYNEFVLLVIIALNLIYWFVSAPDQRFVHGFLIFGFSLSLISVLFLFKDWQMKLLTKPLVLIILTLFCLPGLPAINEEKLKLLTDHWLHPMSVHENTYSKHKTNFEFVVPKEDKRCFDAQLPCMPEVNLNVEQRGDHILHGYRPIK